MNVYNENGESVGEVQLPSEVLETTVNREILHQVVLMHLANRRSGTASTKRRSEVSGSGKKLYRQKGTGMARAGMRRTPVRVGGGVAFGPRPRDYSYKVPKKVKHKAIKYALVDKFQNNNVLILDSINLDRPKTKQLVGIMDRLGLQENEKVLIVLDAFNENVFYSVSNIPRLNVCIWNDLNTYDILWHDKLLFTRSSFERIQSTLLNVADNIAGAQTSV